MPNLDLNICCYCGEDREDHYCKVCYARSSRFMQSRNDKEINKSIKSSSEHRRVFLEEGEESFSHNMGDII